MSAQVVGELFVNIGVKGGEKAKKVITETKSGLQQVADSGWKAKLAIVAAIVAVEKMFSKTSKMGTNISLLSTVLGVDPKIVTNFRWAMQQAGLDANEADSALKSMSDTFSDLAFNKPPPEFFAALKDLAGITTEEIFDPKALPQVIDKLWAASKGGRARELSKMFQSFGISDNVFSAFRLLKEAPSKYKDPFNWGKSAEQLRRTDVAMKNLQSRWDNISKGFTLKYGERIVTAIEKLAGALDRFVDVMTDIEIKFGLIGEAATFAGRYGKSYQEGIGGLINAKDEAKRGEISSSIMDFLISAKKLTPGETFKSMLRERISPNVNKPTQAPPPANIKIEQKINGNPTPEQLKELEKHTMNGVKNGLLEVNRATFAAIPTRGQVV